MGVVWHRVDKVAVEVDGKIVAKLQKTSSDSCRRRRNAVYRDVDLSV
ncbi:phage protein [Streptococcus dysgalactiae]|nr:phage protein [Streptococcus dysgalactiae]